MTEWFRLWGKEIQLEMRMARALVKIKADKLVGFYFLFEYFVGCFCLVCQRIVSTI